MATIAEMEIPTDEFALRDTLTAIDGVAFEVEQIAAHDENEVMPYIWASGAPQDRIEAALRDDETVAEFELLTDDGTRWLYRMTWVDATEALVHLLIEEDAAILAAFGKGGHWDLRILFPKREGLSRTHEYCRDAGLTLDIRRIHDHTSEEAGRFGLTEKQADTLVLALQHGYFGVPRDAQAQEIADELGISHQALSERLRRATSRMVENGLLVGQRSPRSGADRQGREQEQGRKNGYG